MYFCEVIVAIGILLGYMGLLYFGAIIAPGVGLSGHLLVQLPAWLLDWAMRQAMDYWPSC